MDAKRAEEIMQSKGVINVSYNGTQIWLEGVKGEMAMVSVIGGNKRMDVPLNTLTESSLT